MRRGLLPLTAACSLLLVVGALLPTRPGRRDRPASARSRWLGGISYAVVPRPLAGDRDRRPLDRSTARRAGPSPSWRSRWRSPSSASSSSSTRFAGGGSSARPLAVAAAATLAIVAVTAVVDGRATGRLPCSAVWRPKQPVATPSDGAGCRLRPPRVAIFGDSVGLSLLLALGDTAVTPEFERAPSEVDLGCGIALSPSPPPDQPGAVRRPGRAVRRQGSGPRCRRGGHDLVPVGAARPTASRRWRRAVRHRRSGVRRLRPGAL